VSESVAAAFLAAAVLIAEPRSGSERLRVITARNDGHPPAPPLRPRWVVIAGVAAGVTAGVVTGSVVGGVLSAALAAGLGLAAHRSAGRPRRRDDPVDLASAWAQLAVCLEVGLPVAAAVAAAAESLDGPAGEELRRVAGLLELGADPVQAWDVARRAPPLAAFARAAARSAGTGAALARSARAEATRLRAALGDAAETRAQRTAVLITAPLGLCFLPAFLVLGIAPVVIGLADDALSWW
jgi:pilus assembly protein TadC